ncbi:Gfo/Idh/MocA family protein [Nafulsella turpanensis]|uniref:Gfo/Idh/MocA family protein n=1 Tax=Nafulsella turpanensis TaxID=1265690 RepID=UPI0003483517|nr:Gfo/Idh/MocA family oxidoreductase [Nafulsella turpanensis]
MEQKKTGFAIIGTGAIARHHARSIQELESSELLAVCSRSPERAAEAEDRFGVKAYSDMEEMLNRPDIEVVAICTESGYHLEPALAAARAGKHVLIEKPIEVTLERTDEIIAACRSAGVKLGVIFQNRFTPGYLRLREAVQKDLLGRLIMGNAYIKWFRHPEYYSSSQWKGTIKGDGGAALINQGIHTIDLLLDIMPEVESVYGQVKTVLHDIEGEDLGLAMLNFIGGAMGTIEGGTSLYPGYPERLEVYGEKGSVILEGGEIKQWNIQGEEELPKKEKAAEKSGSADPMAISHQLHLAQIKDMVEAVQENREPLVNGETARKSLALILAVYQSSKENKPVSLR